MWQLFSDLLEHLRHNFMSKPKALHFGAGNIGRGFIGPLLVESGYHVVFADVDSDTIDKLNEAGHYTFHVIGDECQRHLISSISGVISHNEEVVPFFSDPAVQLVTTAVGPNILAKVAPTIAKGLQARRQADAGSLNIIACENMVGQTAQLARYVFQYLTTEEKNWVDAHVGFASCSVDCIVPPCDPSQKTLDVHVEDFHEWIVDEDALRMAIEPKVKGMQLTQDLEAFVERKLFTLNCAHAIAAYLGYVKRYQTVDQAMQDDQIRDIVRGALYECGAALIMKHHFDRTAHMEYIEKILGRISDPSLGDSVVRVGRQPLRKLGKTDRLLGPANLARKYGLPDDNLMRGIAAAFLYNAEDDKEGTEMQEKVKRSGIAKVVEEITGYVEGSEAHAKVIEAYRNLEQQ